MTYYKHTENDTVRMLMDALDMEAHDSLDWTLQELFAMCRDVTFIVDDPQNADYSDCTYLVLAELYVEFRRYGQMVDVPEDMKRVQSFTMDEAARQELLSGLAALQSGRIHGRTRTLTAEWEEENTLLEWQNHVNELIAEITEALPEEPGIKSAGAAADGTFETTYETASEKRRKRSKMGTAIFLAVSCLATWFSLYLILYGASGTYNYWDLRVNGVKTTAEVTQIASEIRPTDSSHGRISSWRFEVVQFTAENGTVIESRLSGKEDSDELYSVGDVIGIYYDPSAPAVIMDAGSNTRLMNGIMAIVFGLLIFVGITALSKSYFASLGAFGGILSAASKAVLLALALGMLAYMNLYSLYRCFPAKDEAYCINSDGLMMGREDGKPYSGRLRDWEDNSLSVYSYKDGLLDGLDVVYDNGVVKEIGHWKAGKQNGLFLLYTSSGILIDYANFENGERHGLTRQYDHETGVILVEGKYNNGQLDGAWTQYYPYGGVAMVKTYRDGVLNGPAQQYYEDGQIQIDMNYIDGIASGPYKAYYSGGQIQVEGTLEDGEYGSDVKMYREDGTPVEFR